MSHLAPLTAMVSQVCFSGSRHRVCPNDVQAQRCQMMVRSRGCHALLAESCVSTHRIGAQMHDAVHQEIEESPFPLMPSRADIVNIGSASADGDKSPLGNLPILGKLSADKKQTKGSCNYAWLSRLELSHETDGQTPKRRGPKPDSKPALTRRQELNRQAQRYARDWAKP